MKCEYCNQQEATAAKVELERSWSDVTGSEVARPVIRGICGECAYDLFDGTEDFPGTIPLPR